MATPSLSRQPSRSGSRFLLITVLLAAIGLALVLTHRQAIYDWVRLYNYQAPAAIAQLANQDTMTPAARHAYYVNHPALEGKTAFAPHCPSGTEQTVVLGCYISGQQGIYLLRVSDQQLSGIEQVTAAHETLHALYDRLGAADRAHVDAMLMDYYEHGLTDPTIKQQLDAYRKTEPGQLKNEIHSIFGTEVADLPAPLEDYYKQYFTNRAQIVRYYTAYQAAFTSRQAQIKNDDAQLAAWHTKINQDEADLQQRQRSLNSQQAALNSARASGDTAGYNSQVTAYNSAVDAYNSEVDAVHQLIRQYNQLVNDRNAIALEEQQLVQAITSSTSSR